MLALRLVALAVLPLCWLDMALAANLPTQAVKVPGLDMPLSWIPAPPEYRLTQTGIAITAPGKTDKYIHAGGGYAPDNAPLLVFDDTDQDFIFSTAVSHPFASKYDSGGLIVEADSKHWFKFEFERDYTGAHRVVSVVTNDYSDDANAISIDSDSAYLQVARQGDAFSTCMNLETARPGTWYARSISNIPVRSK